MCINFNTGLSLCLSLSNQMKSNFLNSIKYKSTYITLTMSHLIYGKVLLFKAVFFLSICKCTMCVTRSHCKHNISLLTSILDFEISLLNLCTSRKCVNFIIRNRDMICCLNRDS